MDATPTCTGGLTPPHGSRSYTGIGPLEVLRVALMRGDLDDLRNDLARALRRNDIPPGVLAGLLHGLQGIGINLENARQELAMNASDRAAPEPYRWVSVSVDSAEPKGTSVATETRLSARARTYEWVREENPYLHPAEGSCSGLRPSIGENSASTGIVKAAQMPFTNAASLPQALAGAGGRKTSAQKENASGVAERGNSNSRSSKQTARRRRSGGKRWEARR